MASDPTPFMTRFFYYFEKKWIFQTKQSETCRRVVQVQIYVRLIEDISTFINAEFENIYNNIYPDQI